MATNFRSLINQVLVLLSEDEISDATTELTDKYEKLVAAFVNQIKEMVEEEHNWRALRSTEQVTVAAAASSAVITNANERSRVLRVYDEMNGEERALVFDVTDAGNPYRLREMDLSELLRRRSIDTTNGNDPQFFAVDNTGEDGVSLQVYPTPTDERTIDITMIIPQNRLSVSTDLDTNIKVPVAPIEAGATWYALEERGEELGVSGIFTEEYFNRRLGAAVARDAAEQGEYNLVPV